MVVEFENVPFELKKRIGKESPNLFIETLSKIEENTSGGPKQAIEKNCYWYAHLFYNDIFVLFKKTEIFTKILSD